MAPSNRNKPEDKITYFGETDARSKRLPFGIRASDRTRHMYIIGKTGMGKSTMLENMAIQDIRNGEGFAFIDPHGKTADLLLDYIPQERIKDVVYFAPFDLEHPISFNVMEDVGVDRRHLVANGLMSAFKKIWVDAWSARMEYILNNILLALLEYPDSTLVGVNRMLVDKDYRLKVVDNISDPSVKAFWTDEFAKYGERYMQEAGAAIQNKIGQFISNPLVRNIIGQPKSTFDIRKIMDEKKILIVNLSKGRVGEANANLLGSMLITKIYLGAMSRADVSPSMLKNLPNFYLYVDEFQSFANESFADILSEARKYKLNLTIAHQYIEQMSEEVRAAVFGNVGSMVTFRVGALDAEVLEKEYFPTFTKEDLVNLGFVQIYLKLMIDGVTSQPFSATTLPPIEKPLISFKEDIIASSRETYAKPRSFVEENIKIWHEPIRKDARQIVDGKQKRIIPAPRQNPEENLRSVLSKTYVQPQQPIPVSESKPIVQPVQVVPIVIPVIQQTQVQSQPSAQKPQQQQPSHKKDKGPKPENVSALRDALAAVLKDSAKEKSQPPVNVNINNTTQNITQTNIHQENKSKEEPVQPKQEEKKQEYSKQETIKEEKKHHPEGVPEHVLRKVLELDK